MAEIVHFNQIKLQLKKNNNHILRIGKNIDVVYKNILSLGENIEKLNENLKKLCRTLLTK